MSERRNSTAFSLLVGGEEYSGWKTLRVTRGLERCVSDFEVTVSERWGVDEEIWQILPGEALEIKFEDETVLTGYVDAYRPSYDAGSHDVRLSGRSKTCDFVDSSVLVDGGQFTGMTVGEIATELAKPFNLEVVVETDGPPEPEVQVQQGETCFALVERLSRLQELLVTDDAAGRLVLCRAGSGQATALRHGRNIKSASADLDNSQRFSEYIVKAQRPGNNKRAADDAVSGGDSIPWEPTLQQLRNIPNICDRYRQRMALLRRSGGKTNPKALTQIGAAVRDEGVTRYRPHLIVAEAQADDAHAQKRAEWEMRRRLARAIRATIQVNGWRQQDGRLWTTNEMVEVSAPWLALDHELIIAQVQYSFDDGGEMTGLELTLPDAFLPEPKRKGKHHHERDERAAESSRRPGRKKAGKAADPWAHMAPTT